VNPPSYAGRREPGQAAPVQRTGRASDGDAWLVMSACMPYAVPIETVVRKPERPLPFGMLKRVARAEVLDARRDIRGRRNA